MPSSTLKAEWAARDAAKLATPEKPVAEVIADIEEPFEELLDIEDEEGDS